VDPCFLVTLWAGIAISFHFALPLFDERYATSVVVFTWPAIVAEMQRRRNILFRMSLALCCIVSLTGASYYSIKFVSRIESIGNTYRPMETALQQLPRAIRQVYILVADGLPEANPEAMRLALDVRAEIIHVVDINWNCAESHTNDLVAF